MKKFFLFALMLTMGMVAKAECQDGPYGLQINGSQVVDAPKFGDPDAQGRVQYKASCVDLKSGDVIKLINQSCGATWMVDLDPYGEYQKFEGGAAAGQLTCKADGKYDFYIKLSMDAGDLVYVGPGENCDGGQGGGQGGGTGVEGNPRYYYKMYTKSDDTWHEPSEETIFDHGVAEMINYTGEAYVFVLFQVDGQGGVQYRTEEFMDATHRSVKLVREGPKDWQLPEGVTNLYLYDEGNDTYTLSADPIPGKKLADPQPAQGIEDTAAPVKAHKVFIDGQLRIVRGDKIFDVTGRQL